MTNTDIAIGEQRLILPIRAYISRAVFINSDEFVVAPFTTNSSCLYKYNIDTNKWDEFIQYPSDLKSTHHSLTYNKSSNELYLYGKECSLIIINLNTKQFKITNNLITTGLLPSSIIIDNEYHIIGGTMNKTHCIYKPDLNLFQTVHTFNDWVKSNCNNGLIHISSKQILLLFGGYDAGKHRRFNKMWCYDLKNKEWNLFNTTMPYKMQSFGYMVTKNERYIMCFGGLTDEYGPLSTIHILDLMDLKWYHCGLQTIAGMCYALCSSKKGDDLLVYGYLREFSDKTKMNIPLDIYQLVLTRYKREFVHILSRYGDEHLKIEIDDILNKATPITDLRPLT